MLYIGEYRPIGTEKWKSASPEWRRRQKQAKSDCKNVHLLHGHGYEFRIVLVNGRTIFESKPPHGWRLRWMSIMLVAPVAFAVDFKEADQHSQVTLAPRTVVADLNAKISGTEFRELAWRHNTVLMEYTMVDQYGRTSEGFYLADVGPDGNLSWYAHTFEPPKRYRALESAQGADAATTLAGLGQGLVEANPAGPFVFPAKLGLVLGIKNGSALECFSAYSPVTRIGWAAAAWNLGVMAGLGPVAALPAVAGAFISKPDENDVFWACAPEVEDK